VARRLDVHGSSACPGEHSHTVPAALGWLAWLRCPLVAGAVCVDARDVDADGADPEPDPQAAASKETTAARTTPVSAPDRHRGRTTTPVPAPGRHRGRTATLFPAPGLRPGRTATPVSAPDRRPRRTATPPSRSPIRSCPAHDEQLGCISRSLTQVAREVNAGPRRPQTRRPTSRLRQFADGGNFRRSVTERKRYVWKSGPALNLTGGLPREYRGRGGWGS